MLVAIALTTPTSLLSPLQACGFHSVPSHWNDYYAALSHKIFSQGDCGKCARVCGNGNCVVVMVLDECMGCSSGSWIDLSEPAMKVLTGTGYDEVNDATWSFTSCGGGGSVSKKQKKRKHRGLLAAAE